jgi:hypothetical protein
MSCVSGGLLEALSGVQEPSFRRVPAAAIGSEGDDAVFLAAQYGLEPDPWQERVLRDWLGRRPDGKWAATRCGLAVPRQNGKNGVLEMRELYGMVLLGETFLHTAHEVKTARKAYKRLLSFFDDERTPPRFPELTALVAEIRRANGQEAIYLTNGGSVEFIARSKGSGRGFTVDVIVMDEAQELSEDALAALVPTRSAAPLRNPQLIFTGTPPAPTMNGEVFTRTRAAGLEGRDPRLAWHEWSIPAPGHDDPPLDLDDPGLLARSNPALGGRVLQETIEDDRSGLSYEGFARERLGVWFDGLGMNARPIDPRAWEDLQDAGSAPEKVAAFGVEVSLDRAFSAIGVAGLRADRRIHVELLPTRRGGAEFVGRGAGWVISRCVELDAAQGPAVWALDGGGEAAGLADDLQKAGLKVIIMSTADVAAASSGLAEAVRDKTVVPHGPRPELVAAVEGAKKRPLNDGKYALGRRVSTADITALLAVRNAWWATDLGYDVLNSIY